MKRIILDPLRLNMLEKMKGFLMEKSIEAAQCSSVWGAHVSRVLQALAACLALMFAERAAAQEFTTLYNFTNGIEGGSPLAGLILSGNTLYGTTSTGGIGLGDYGTVFAVNTDGTGFRNLYRFTGGSDGYRPSSGLVLSSNILYGTAYYGGASGNGTVFAINTNGMGFTNLYSFSALSNFTNSDGANPYAGLILSGRTLYGTTYKGGSSRYGTVFALNTDGTGFTNLHTFNHDGSDGYFLYAGLILSGNTLYGTTTAGGSGDGGGTVFALNTNGTGFTVLYNFGTNSSVGGESPVAGLVLSGNLLYGTAQSGGSSAVGTVFALNTNGTGFTVLHNFTYADGVNFFGTLVLSGNTLYGTAQAGGTNVEGTVFAVNTDGSSFTNLHNFYFAEGSDPEAGLLLSGQTLYGTAYDGGSGGFGTVFSLSFRPQVTITASRANIVLTWPTNAAGFDYTGYTLQSSTNLTLPAAWSSVTNVPVVIAGQSTVTNPITATQQFYRLSQ